MSGHFDFLKKPLAREIAVIVLIKLVLLLGIRSLWFDAGVDVKDDGTTVGRHVLGPASQPLEKNLK
jgi:hypothetical protein